MNTAIHPFDEPSKGAGWCGATVIDRDPEPDNRQRLDFDRDTASAFRAQLADEWGLDREAIRDKLAEWPNREAAEWHERCLDLAQTAGEYELLLDHRVGTPMDQLKQALSGASVAGVSLVEVEQAGIAVQNREMQQRQQVEMPEGSWLHAKDNGKPLATLANFKRMLSHYGIHPRYNLVAKRDESLVPGLATTRDNHDNVTLSHVTSLANMNRMPIGQLGEYMLAVADENAYNPVLDWIKSKPWDGADRLTDLLDGVAVSEQFDYELKDTLIRRWLVSAVAAIAKPSGFHARGVLVFTGPQGVGKTSWFRNLLPDQLGEYFKEGATIDPADKDSVTSAVSNWIVEIGELDATFRKSDIARLKAFVTSGEDRIRKPYARAESMLPRRTVFCGSVNDAQFLVDPTGNSRFWTVEVTCLDYEQPTDDLQQVWAQVYELYKAGEQWWLTPDEEVRLAASNGEYEQVDPLEELFLSTYDMASPERQKSTASEVLKALGYDKPTRRLQADMSKVLKTHCGDYTRTGKGRFYEVPIPKVTTYQ